MKDITPTVSEKRALYLESHLLAKTFDIRSSVRDKSLNNTFWPSTSFIKTISGFFLRLL
jgi:hypothetical protein